MIVHNVESLLTWKAPSLEAALLWMMSSIGRILDVAWYPISRINGKCTRSFPCHRQKGVSRMSTLPSAISA